MHRMRNAFQIWPGARGGVGGSGLLRWPVAFFSCNVNQADPGRSVGGGPCIVIVTMPILRSLVEFGCPSRSPRPEAPPHEVDVPDGLAPRQGQRILQSAEHEAESERLLRGPRDRREREAICHKSPVSLAPE